MNGQTLADRITQVKVEGQTVHRCRGFNTRTRTRDRVQERNERMNRLWVRYTERLDVLRGRIAHLVTDGVDLCMYPKKVRKLAKTCLELRARRERILLGDFPKKAANLCVPEPIDYSLFPWRMRQVKG